MVDHLWPWALLITGIGELASHPVNAAADSSLRPSAVHQMFDTKSLIGNWRVESWSGYYKGEEGKNLIAPGAKHTLTIQADNRMILAIAGVKVIEWGIRYDEKKKPAWLDLAFRFVYGHKPEGKKALGIISAKGDELSLHLSTDKRPKGFEQQKEITSMLFRCRRIMAK